MCYLWIFSYNSLEMYIAVYFLNLFYLSDDFTSE